MKKEREAGGSPGPVRDQALERRRIGTELLSQDVGRDLDRTGLTLVFRKRDDEGVDEFGVGRAGGSKRKHGQGGIPRLNDAVQSTPDPALRLETTLQDGRDCG